MSILRVPSWAVRMAAALVVSFATVAPAQEAAPEATTPRPPSPAASPQARRGVRPGDVQKVFVLKHVRVDDMTRVLSVFPAEISGMSRDTMRVLSVSAGPAVVAAIEETIKRLDVPPPPLKSVEVTAYVLECAAAPDAGTVPQELQDVVVQLRRTFNYSGCALARTLFTRAADDGRMNSEFRERGAGIYYFYANVVEVESSEPFAVRFRGFKVQHADGSQGGQVNGDIEVRDGQKVVLGRLGTVASGKDEVMVLTVRMVP